jgi:hypothetical protein
MIVGRATIGLCMGSIYSMLSYFLSSYFIGGYLSVILSVLLGLGNLFDSLNVSISPVIISSFSVQTLLLLHVTLAVFSFINTLILVSLDKKIENEIKVNK